MLYHRPTTEPLRTLGSFGSPFFMELSHYLIVAPCPEQPGQLLFFSTRKGSLSILPEAAYSALLAGQRLEQFEEQLVKLGILVADRDQERADVLDYVALLNRLSTVVTASIIPGLSCNFSCIYCYEGSQKGSHKMSGAVAEQAVDFLKKRFLQAANTKMVLDFYGGEPLLYPELITYFASRLKPFVEERGGVFEITLVSNGSLLTRQRVAELLPHGLASVKITMDGPPETHNRFRPFRTGKPSFDAVLANMKEYADLVRIGLGGNFTRETYQRFPELLDILLAAGLGPDKIDVFQFSAVMQVADQFALPNFHGGCVQSSEPWLAEAALFLRDEVKKRGYATPRIIPSACMIDMANGFVIHYDGSLYKCVAMIGHKEFQAGDLWQGFHDYAAAHHLENFKDHEPCATCLYLPLCFGGCRYMEFQRSGSMAKVDCLKDYFDKVLLEMVRQDIQYRHER